MDDDPKRMALALDAIVREGGGRPDVLHVICRSRAIADVVGAALVRRRPGRSWPAAWERMLVAGHVHVLEGRLFPTRAVDCSLDGVDWLGAFFQRLHRQGHALDVIAGSSGTLRFGLLVLAMGAVSPPDDRLWLLRTPSQASRAGRRPAEARGRDARVDLLPVPILCASPRQHESLAPFRQRREHRLREWGALRDIRGVVVDLARRAVIVGEVAVTLPVAQLFWYAAVASAPNGFPFAVLRAALVPTERGGIAIRAGTRDERAITSILASLRDLMCRVSGPGVDHFERLVLNACSGEAPQLPSTLAKVAKALRHALGDAAAERYVARAVRGEGTYVVGVPARLVGEHAPRGWRRREVTDEG